jgi:SOS-response transcriptional repressor LexA
MKYPKNDIDIEYPVQHYSERGFVDVIVFQNRNGKKEPYIMAEVKKTGEDMDRAMKQLHSYVFGCETVKYIMITDGVNITTESVSNGRYTPIKSIPEYKGNEANLYEKYHFINWENRRKFEYDINSEDKGEIIIKDADAKEVIEYKDLYSVNVIGQVAAGTLKYANEELIGKFFMPDMFTGGRKDLFMLEVNGDSMIDFGINNGDYVLIKKQDFAQNKDIVVAGKRGENQVTLKQYFNFGDKIGLIPGNSKYEQIMINAGEIFINGVLIGVLTRNSPSSNY